MVVPYFLHFYPGYTMRGVLDEYAVTFFSLVNALHRIKASQTLDIAYAVSVGISGDQSAADKLRKAGDGLHGMIQEVRVVKRVRGE